MNEVSDPHGTIEVDASGWSCPRPVRELARAIDAAEVGQLVVLTATDPTARVDVPVWCRLHRHRLHRIDAVEDTWRFVVQRSG